MSQELPSNQIAEAFVLAQVMRSHQADILLARDNLPDSSSFFKISHRFIWWCVLFLDARGDRIDRLSVERVMTEVSGSWMQRRVQLEDQSIYEGTMRPKDAPKAPDAGEATVLHVIGGSDAITEIMDTSSMAVLFERNVHMLRDLAQKRFMIRKLGDVTHEAHGTITPTDLMDRINGVISAAPSIGGIQILTGHSLEHHFLESTIDQNAQSRVTFGYDGFNDLIQHVQHGFYILAARPGAGKTTFILGTARENAKKGLRVLFVSLEMTGDQIVAKLISSETGRSYDSIVYTDKVERKRLYQSVKGYVDQISITDNHNITIDGFRTLIRRQCAGKLKPDVIIIDYLQLLGRRQNQTEYEAVSESSRLCKTMSLDCRIPIIALSQMSRDSEKGQGKSREPKLADLRGSGSLEQDADAVIFLHNIDESKYKDEHGEHRVIKVILAKNRFGKQDALYYDWRMKDACFSLTEKPEDSSEAGEGQRIGKDLRERMKNRGSIEIRRQERENTIQSTLSKQAVSSVAGPSLRSANDERF